MKKIKSQPIPFHYKKRGDILTLLDELNELLLDVSPGMEIDLDINGKLSIYFPNQEDTDIEQRPYQDDIEELLKGNTTHLREF